MASKFAGTLSPTAEPAPEIIDQPTQRDNGKNNMTTTSESSERAATAPPQDHHPTKEREDGLRAQSLEYKTHLEQDKDTSQPPSNNKDSSTSVNPDTAPIDPRDAAATIAALQQQLYSAEQHILHFRNEASSQIFQLENLVRSSWDRSNNFEASVNYLSGELHKANDFNGTLNQHIIELRKEAETRKMKHQAALQAANANARARARASSSRTPPVLPPLPPPLPPAVMQQTDTLLEHNRASIVKLRAEIRELKASKKQLQERLLTLGSVPPLDGSTFLQSADLPREVLNEWSQVLLQRDREIAGLWVKIEREREARAQTEQAKCSKCEPVAVVDDEDKA